MSEKKQPIKSLKIFVDKKNCKHLREISYYNNNYYELPFTVNDCNILYEEYYGDESFAGHKLGILIDNIFQAKYYLHTEDHLKFFIIDLQEISENNRWT